MPERTDWKEYTNKGGRWLWLVCSVCGEYYCQGDCHYQSTFVCNQCGLTEDECGCRENEYANTQTE